MYIRRSIALLSVAMLASLGMLASCGELITSEPPPERAPNAQYTWSTGEDAEFVALDGSTRSIDVTGDDENATIIDASNSGTDTLHLEKHQDSVLLHGLSRRSFLPIPFGGRLESDTQVSITNYPASTLLGDQDSLFFVSGRDIMVYDHKQDAISPWASFPSRVTTLERSYGSGWFAITEDDHLWYTTDRGQSWSDQGTIPGHVTAAEASPFKTIYVATDRGEIKRYDPATSSWSTAFTLAPVRHVNCLKYWSFGPNYTLFAGTEDGYVLTLQSSNGSQRADALSVQGSPIAITGLALDFAGHDRVWAAGNGAVFVGKNYGQSWKQVDGVSINAVSMYNFGDQIWIGTGDGRVIRLHDDDAPQIDQVSNQPIQSITASFGELQAISGTTIYSASKHDWRALNTSITQSTSQTRPWVLLTKDSVWKAADVVVGGVRYIFTGRVLDRAREMKLHGKSHRGILVVRYAVEADDSTPVNKDVPMYIIYFQVKHGPIRIEILQQGKQDIIEEVD